jgi:hypothetical protein
MQDDRSDVSSECTIYDGGNKVGQFRKFATGDLITVIADFDEGWFEMRVNLEEFKHRFNIPGKGHDNYYIGATVANDHKLLILPFPVDDITAFYEASKRRCSAQAAVSTTATVSCAENHKDLECCIRNFPTTYLQRYNGSAGITVSCDVCSRKSIHLDRMPYYHCHLCSYDVCFACSLLKHCGAQKIRTAHSNSESAGSGSINKSVGGKQASSTRLKRSPLASLVPKCAPHAALEKVDALARKLMNCAPITISLVSTIESKPRKVQKCSEIAVKSRNYPIQETPEVQGKTQNVSLPRDVGLTYLFSAAVMKESLEDMLDVVAHLIESSEDFDSEGQTDNLVAEPRILEFASRMVSRLFGVDTYGSRSGGVANAQCEAPSDASELLDVFFPCSTERREALSIFELFGVLNWIRDSSLTTSDKQAICILEAISTISCTDSNAFTVSDDAYLDLLLRMAERGALVLYKMDEYLSSSNISDEMPPVCNRFQRRDVYIGAAALNIAYTNILRATKIAGPQCRLLETKCLSNDLVQGLPNVPSIFNAAKSILTEEEDNVCSTYRDRINRLCGIIVSNRRINPRANAFGAYAVQFASLKDALFPKPAQQFAVICELLEKSEAANDTPCERALVMKLMEGLEGPKLLELLSPLHDFNSHTMGDGDLALSNDDTTVENFFISVLQLADRSIISTIKREQLKDQLVETERSDTVPKVSEGAAQECADGVRDSGNVLSSQNLSAGMIRLLDPIGIQIFCSVISTIVTTNEGKLLNPVEGDSSRPLLRLVSISNRLLRSSHAVVEEINKRAALVTNCNSFNNDKLSTEVLIVQRYKKLIDELASSHVACLVPLSLFSIGLLWRVLNKSNRRDLGEVLLGLSGSLQCLTGSLCDAVRANAVIESLYSQVNDSTNLSTEDKNDVVHSSSTLNESIAVSSWDSGMSNTSLTFTDSNRVCGRPGSASCYPAAFAPCEGTCSTFTVSLTEANSTTNWLSIGVCQKGFAVASSDGFGRTAKSWYGYVFGVTDSCNMLCCYQGNCR